MGAVVDFPRMTYPEDLLWAEPGAPVAPARQVQVFDAVPPRQFLATPTDSGDLPPRGLPMLVYIAAALIIGVEIGFIGGCYLALWVRVGGL